MRVCMTHDRFPPIHASFGPGLSDMVAAMLTVAPDARPCMQDIRAACLRLQAGHA